MTMQAIQTRFIGPTNTRPAPHPLACTWLDLLIVRKEGGES